MRVRKDINSANLEHNLKMIKKLSKNSEIMAVVKADAYGHNIKKMTTLLSQLNVNHFAVATLSEALIVRQLNKNASILILGYVDISDLNIVKENDLCLTLIDYEYAKMVSVAQVVVKAQIKVNTGMNRAGENFDNYDKIKCMYNLPFINTIGIYSHLGASDSLKEDDTIYTKLQIERYDNLLRCLKADQIDVGITHIQASYGLLNYPNLSYDFVRIGIILYGLLSSGEHEVLSKVSLKPVLSLKSKIVSIKEIKANARVSYSNSFISKRTMKVATVSIGYADGISRSLSNSNFQVLINDKLCSVVGNICMDQFCVDVSHLSNVSLFDDVILFDDNYTIYHMSKCAQTIVNDTLSSLNIRE